MLEIIAGHCEEYRFEVESVLDESELAGHMSVVAVRDLDTERYAEAELSDAELLALAAEEAEEARRARRLGGPALDEVALRRALRRSWRAGQRRVLRTQVAGGVA